VRGVWVGNKELDMDMTFEPWQWKGRRVREGKITASSLCDGDLQLWFTCMVWIVYPLVFYGLSLVTALSDGMSSTRLEVGLRWRYYFDIIFYSEWKF
jgi:hypothetical protein